MSDPQTAGWNPPRPLVRGAGGCAWLSCSRSCCFCSACRGGRCSRRVPGGRHPWWSSGTLLFAAAFVGLPVMMMLGHGRRHLDWAAVTGDALLGAIWVLFVWSVSGAAATAGAAGIAGVDDPDGPRIVAAAVVGVVARAARVGLCRGDASARAPDASRSSSPGSALGWMACGSCSSPTRTTDRSTAPLVGSGDERVNELDADIVCHVGDIADGTVAVREVQAMPLAAVRARLARVYVTGNHEYFSEAQGWLDYMESIGWDALHNRHSSSNAAVTAHRRWRRRRDRQGVRRRRTRREPRGGTGRRRPGGAGAAARASAQTDHPRGRGRRGPANLRAYARRADLAVQLPGPTRSTGGAG